jgi:hypothetical protein
MRDDLLQGKVLPSGLIITLRLCRDPDHFKDSSDAASAGRQMLADQCSMQPGLAC